ncbi:MAG TPA: RagB/SusD family nutrient uptake outer membrane protein [Bacteroidales bacterium]|nr:RagB/SusD family nutrient uptake outer membrane protein [Bacteroidales bacterium]
MKKIIIILTTVFAVVSFTACNKFLDLEPKSNNIWVNDTGDSILYQTANEVETALAGVYADFRNEYFELDYFIVGDAQSDDAYAGADNPWMFEVDDYNLNALNGLVTRDWRYLYGTIGLANLVINNVMLCPDPSLTQERRNEILGEASFIRAYIYFRAVQTWGEVPLQLKEVTTVSAEVLPEIYPLLFPDRAPVDSVYTQIISDLEVALANVKPVAEHKGFATTGAVNAVLAKVYATMEPPDYNKVVQYCDAVINGGYSLLPNFEDLWNNSAENTAESIFEVNYEGTATNANWGVNMFLRLFGESDWKKFNVPSNDLVKAYDDEGDVIRRNSTIIFSEEGFPDNYWPQDNYPFIWKWRISGNNSPQNYIFLRLADIILLKAEALNELGDVNGAAELVNQIRGRVDLPNTTAAGQDEMRLAIEKERRLELAFEGHRWFDLKRTGRAIEVINNAVDQNGQKLGYNLTENRLLWPIPQGELDLNTSLVQNPGY